MEPGVRPFLQRDENLIHQCSVRPPFECMLLRFAHLGGSHHLHCFGDLRGVADRFDPAPYVLRVRHLNVQLNLPPGGLEFVERRFQLRLDVLIQFFFLANRLEQTDFARL